MKLFTALLILASMNSFASTNATVKMVRGKVTVLKPGKHEVAQVKEGDVLPQNSSILTADKSIVKLLFKDKSVVSLGPNSKIIIDVSKKKEKNVISLLKGVIRAEVKKTEDQSTNKMLIKTRTAVMGIRGTKLKTSYNPINTNTSLVTIEGDVAMAKVDKNPVVEAFKENADVKDLEAAIEKKMEKKLASTESVHVKNGRFAGVIKDHIKPTEPVKIAPKQLVALTKNDELASEVVKKSKEDILEAAKKFDTQDPSIDGVDDKLTGKLADKAGGLIDFNTGIYVPPTDEAVLDEKNHVYVDKKEKTGTISSSGDYIPPKGVELDAKKGFVLKDSKEILIASNDLSAIKETIAELNKDAVKRQVKQKTYAKISYKDIQKYLPQNHFMTVGIQKMSADFILETPSNSKLKVNSENAEVATITLNQVWSEKNATYIKYKKTNISLQNVSDGGRDFIQDKNLENMNALIFGYKRRISVRTEIDIYFGDEDRVNVTVDEFVFPAKVRASATEFGLFGIGLNYFLYENRKTTFFAHTHINKYDYKSKENFFSPSGEPKDATEAQISGTLNYALRDNLKFSLTSFFNYTKAPGTKGYDLTRQATGFGTGLIWDF